MNQYKIQDYKDFVNAMMEVGFSMGGSSREGIFSLLSWNWNEEPPFETPVSWHTGDPETDPWEWRMRVLEEDTDIAYAKVFFKKSGYITKIWASYFIAVRRSSFEEDYADGVISNQAKRIYEIVRENGALPSHVIKQLAGFGKAEKSAFDRALVELQMKMYLTMCGRQHKVSQKGEIYGWSSTMLCTTEDFWGSEVFDQAAALSKEEAISAITEQILMLNPEAEQKNIIKFIKG